MTLARALVWALLGAATVGCPGAPDGSSQVAPSPATQEPAPGNDPVTIESPTESITPTPTPGSDPTALGPVSTDLAVELLPTEEAVPPLEPDGPPPTGEALAEAQRVCRAAGEALQRRPHDAAAVAQAARALFDPALDHHGPALDLRGQYCARGLAPAGSRDDPGYWFRRAMAYGYRPNGVPEQAGGWDYRRLLIYGLGDEVMNTDPDPEPGSVFPADELPASELEAGAPGR